MFCLLAATVFSGVACGVTSATSGSAPVSSGTPAVNISVSISPSNVNISTGAAQVFTAVVSGANGQSAAIVWSVNGVVGGNATLGTITTTNFSGSTTVGLYSAPAVPPAPASVTLTATSVADGSQAASATVTISCAASNSLVPSSISVAISQTQTFTANFCVPNGTAFVWDVNGVPSGNSALGTIAPTSGNVALYTAPADLPPENPITIHATATAQPGGSATTATATVTITSAVRVAILPPSITLMSGQQTSFQAVVTNALDITVTWFVNGVMNGNSTVGQICETGSLPCTAPILPLSGSVNYLAPASAPGTSPIILAATSHADPSQSAAAEIFFQGTGNSVSVTLSPQYSFLAPSTSTLSAQQFSATVTGAANTAVVWSVASATSGAGCAGSACGSISSGGLYSAPTIAPSPNAISVIATSKADPTKSAFATVAITSGPTVEEILPSSALAGDVSGFPFEIEGTGFVAGSGSSSSTILFNGVARSTTCATTTMCVTTVTPPDVQSPGTITVQISNPGSPGALSNPVPFVIEPFDASPDTISLTAGQPVAAQSDIIVVEPTTAASSSPLDVNFVGLLTGGNTCGAQGSPLTVTRPSSGSAIVSICVQGDNLDPTFTYAFTGPGGVPASNDIGVTASTIAGLFPNMIELDLQISSTTLPGVRSLFITTLNNDRGVATGMLEVQ